MMSLIGTYITRHWQNVRFAPTAEIRVPNVMKYRRRDATKASCRLRDFSP
jgi:hypothetical protein